MTPETAQFYLDNKTAVDFAALHNPYGTAFGLMDEVYGPGTAQALRDSDGPLEQFWDGRWEGAAAISFRSDIAYRLKPLPPKPREWWIINLPGANALYSSRITAKAVAADHGGELIHVREVIE